MNDVVVEVPTETNVPPVVPGARQISYPMTPTLSVDAVQLSVTEPQVALAVGVPGVVGACVSGGGMVGHGGGTMLTGSVKAEVLPAVSRARTLNCNSPVMGWVKEVVVVVPAEVNAPPLVALARCRALRQSHFDQGCSFHRVPCERPLGGFAAVPHWPGGSPVAAGRRNISLTK
ncbi:hypothetical protein GCM10022226_62660 [Sphaerisporangium flaviroseum]|uniref:DUF4150 domain-containing protein n=1 Tax=Sphaerisporangium flaviroseum TaxID=509199 RepID=A0ABP7J3P6_9ACTN